MLEYRVLLSVIAYIAGSIPFGLIVGRYKGVDIRKRGSGNIGATNVARVIGKKWGLLVLFLDFLKGFLPVYIYKNFLASNALHDAFIGIIGLCAVAGHCFSVFLRGRGGKGVATALGVFVAVSIKASLASMAAFIAILKVTGIVSASSLGASFIAPIAFRILTPSPFIEPFIWLISLIIWIKHHANIKRIIEGREIRV